MTRAKGKATKKAAAPFEAHKYLSPDGASFVGVARDAVPEDIAKLNDDTLRFEYQALYDWLSLNKRLLAGYAEGMTPAELKSERALWYGEVERYEFFKAEMAGRGFNVWKDNW